MLGTIMRYQLLI